MVWNHLLFIWLVVIKSMTISQASSLKVALFSIQAEAWDFLTHLMSVFTLLAALYKDAFFDILQGQCLLFFTCQCLPLYYLGGGNIDNRLRTAFENGETATRNNCDQGLVMVGTQCYFDKIIYIYLNLNEVTMHFTYCSFPLIVCIMTLILAQNLTLTILLLSEQLQTPSMKIGKQKFS